MQLVEASHVGGGKVDVAKLRAMALQHAPTPLTRRSLPSLQPGALVQFRGMVQDMFDPELFCLAYNQGRDTGKLRDCVPVDWVEGSSGGGEEEDAKNSNTRPAFTKPALLGERQVLYLVPVPGEAAWARPSTTTGALTTTTETETANLDRMEEEQPSAQPITKSNSFNSGKRVKQQQQQGGDDQPPSALVPDDENLPYPDADLLPCFIKLYQDEDEEDNNVDDRRECKLQDVVTVVGVLSLEYLTCQHADEYETRDCLPAHIAPRIHVISLAFEDSLPIPPPTTTLPDSSSSSSREMCLKLLRDALDNDALAAEYALLWCISSTAPGSEVVGRLTLALTQLPASQAQSLKSVLHLLLARLELCTWQELNTVRFSPSKDVARNRLAAGRLQVAPGTRLVLDETLVSEGWRVNEQGMHNIHALQLLAKSQQVEYDFHGFQRFQQVDAPVLVLTAQRKASLAVPDVDACVPWMGGRGSSGALPPPPAALEPCRAYLERARASVNSTMRDLSPDIAKRVENDYVAARQQQPNAAAAAGGGGVTDKDLHVWLNLAKLTAASLGRQEVTLGDYLRAKTLDEERRKRGL